jgi:hypothetical protein
MSSQRRTMIRWTEDEWTKLVDSVIAIRRNQPELTLVEIVRKSQEQWSYDRRRDIRSVHQVLELIPRMQVREASIEEMELEIESMRDRLDTLSRRPGREQILASLSEEEIVARFARTVLNRLAASLLRPAEVVQPPATSQPVLLPRPVQTRVALLGLRDDQHQIVAGLLSDLKMIFVDKNRQDNCLPQVDYCVIWTKFAPHSYCSLARRQLPAERIILHSGGIQRMVAKIREVAGGGG